MHVCRGFNDYKRHPSSIRSGTERANGAKTLQDVICTVYLALTVVLLVPEIMSNAGGSE